MKQFLVGLMIFFSAYASAESVLICKTLEKVDGWKAAPTHDYVHFTANVRSNEVLDKAKVRGAYASDSRDILSDKKYAPKSPAYKTYNRFQPLEDAWHWFHPLIPKELLSQVGFFTGYLQVMGEEGFRGTLKLLCYLRN